MSLTRVAKFAEYRQEKTERHLINFMQKLNQINSKQQINRSTNYQQSQPDDRCQVETNLGITMVACFGITALATGVIIASTMNNHHYDGYHNYDHNLHYDNKTFYAELFNSKVNYQ